MERAWGTFSSHLTPGGTTGQIQDELSLMSQCLCLDVPHPPPTECARQEESGLDIIWSWTSGWVCPSLPQSLCQWYSALFGLPDSRRWVLGCLQLQHALLSYIWPLLLRQLPLLDALLPRS